MQKAGELARKRVERILIEDEMLRAGFAAFPYLVMNDTMLSVGARFTYAILLQFAWQQEETFPKQETLARRIGISARQVRRYLAELKRADYIQIKRRDKRYNNTYIIKKVRSKLRKKTKYQAERTPVSGRRGHL
jgi:hypothetical protein